MVTKVLIVDDNMDVRSSIKSALRSFGSMYACDDADSVESCFKKISSFKPDVVLMDLMFSGAADAGFDAAMKIKSDLDLKRIRIIFITAREDDEARSKAGVVGESFLLKPFTAESLDATIKSVMAKRSPIYVK